jgi:hypothetical protein
LPSPDTSLVQDQNTWDTILKIFNYHFSQFKSVGLITALKEFLKHHSQTSTPLAQ